MLSILRKNHLSSLPSLATRYYSRLPIRAALPRSIPPAGQTYGSPVKAVKSTKTSLPYPWSWRTTKSGDFFLENLQTKLKVWPETLGIKPPVKGSKLKTNTIGRHVWNKAPVLTAPTSAELNDGVWSALETFNTILVGSPTAYWALFAATSGFLLWYYFNNKAKKDALKATVELPEN